MSGATPVPWSIPYPTGTDRVADGDNAMQALAERQAAIDNALPRGLIGGADVGSFTGSGAIVAITLNAFTTTEARDFLVELRCQGKTVTGGTGVVLDVKDNGVQATQSAICIWAPSGVSSFDSTLSFGQTAANRPSGSHVFTLTVTGYGANNNLISSLGMYVYDMGAVGAI